MHKNPGLRKEEELILHLNGRKVGEISRNTKYLLREMFEHLDDDETIICEKVVDFIKPDFYITYKNKTHYVSMKSGRANTAHQESIEKFILWIRTLGISKKTQATILYYQFGDGTMDGSGKKRLSYDELRYSMSDRIKEANLELNKDKSFVMAVVERCIFKGTNIDNQAADYIYHGNLDYGVLVSRKQMIKHIGRRTWDYVQNLHIGPIHLRPHARYSGKEIYREESRRKLVCYWPNFYSDLDYIAERYDG